MKDNRIKERLVRLFMENPNDEFESYQIEKVISGSKTTINSYLRDLENDSIVVRRCHGYYCFWRLDKRATTKFKMICKKWTPDLFGIDLQDE